MRELESTQQIHLRQIPEAELVTQAAQHDLKDDIGWELEKVKRSARSLIRFTPTPTAVEFSVAEISGPIQLPELGRLAMRTDHGATAGHSRVTSQPTSFLPDLSPDSFTFDHAANRMK